MNRRRFLGLTGLTVAAAVVGFRDGVGSMGVSGGLAVPKPPSSIAAPTWLRGTYIGWERPGVPS